MKKKNYENEKQGHHDGSVGIAPSAKPVRLSLVSTPRRQKRIDAGKLFSDHHRCVTAHTIS